MSVPPPNLIPLQARNEYDEQTGETEDLEAASAMEYRYDGARQRYLVMPRDPETLDPIDPENDGRWRDYAGDGIYLDYKADDIQGGTVNEVRQYLAGVGFNDRNENQMPVHFAGDQIGSNRWMLGTDGSTPPLKLRNVYTAFGEERRSDGELGSRYGYAGAHGYESGGKGEDPLYKLGWLHLGHRYYDPYCGRFMQRDPIGIRGGLNTYVYCSNNPVSAIDPDGLTVIVIQFGGRGLHPGHTVLFCSSNLYYLSFVLAGSKGRTPKQDFDDYGKHPIRIWIIDGLDEDAIAKFGDKYIKGFWLPWRNCVDAVIKSIEAGGGPPRPSRGWDLIRGPKTARRYLDDYCK